jgi:MFS family permease
MLLTLSVTEMVSWGCLYYAFTIFIKPMQDELGWSRGELTGAFSLALVVAGLAGVPVGRWLDRHGTRGLMSAGSAAATLLVLAWATVNSLPLFYMIWAGIGLAMAAVLYDPAFVVVATWFRRQRGRALTVLTFIAGFASVIFIPFSEWLVRLLGWRLALVGLAGLLGLVTFPLHLLILRRRPQDLGLEPDGLTTPQNLSAEERGQKVAAIEPGVTLKLALQGRNFWWLTIAFSLNTLALVAITVHLVPYLTDHGYDSDFAALVVGLIGVTALPGRLVFNLLAEHLPRRFLTAFIFLLQSLSLVALLLIPNIAGVFIFMGLFGAGFGAVTPLRAGLTAELYGATYYGRIASIMGLFITAARGLGPVGAGLVFDFLGNYTLLLWLLVLISALGAITVTLVQTPAKTPSQNQPD